jgi:hypothetical protein
VTHRSVSVATNALKQRLDVLLVHAAGAIDRIDARHSSST